MWSNPNPQSGADKAGQLLLKHESNMTDLYSGATGKLNQLKALFAAASAPSAPDTGQPWWDNVNNALKIYTGTAWVTPGIPSGTKMIFFQAAAPTGWTQDITQSDKALRVVSGVGGASGGSRGISDPNVGSTTLTIAQMPAHTHSVIVGYGNVNSSNPKGQEGADTSHTSSSAGGGGSHNHDLSLAYVDVIICTKD